MTGIYPLHIAREIERRWKQRRRVKAPVAQNDNHDGDTLCPLCGGHKSAGRKRSVDPGAGRVFRFWLCRACGHEWATVLHVPG